jgi:hypothetical protein
VLGALWVGKATKMAIPMENFLCGLCFFGHRYRLPNRIGGGQIRR